MTSVLAESYPGLARSVPRLPIADLPTPVSEHRLSLSAGSFEVAVKRDEITSTLYGGNKVRKLEFLMADAKATIGVPEVKLGLIPGYGGTQRLPRLVGRGRALEILLTGRNVDAEEAEKIGLVNAVCEQTELVDTVDAMLKNILANGPLAVGHCIEAVNHGLDLPFEDACLLEATLFGVGAASEQMREGTSAFLEKRKARFRS